MMRLRKDLLHQIETYEGMAVTILLYWTTKWEWNLCIVPKTMEKDTNVESAKTLFCLTWNVNGKAIARATISLEYIFER